MNGIRGDLAAERTVDVTEPWAMTDPGCDEIRELMLAEGDRELSEFELGRIERHVSSCPGCEAEVAGDPIERAQLRAVRDEIDWPVEREWQEVEAGIAATRPGTRWLRPRPR